MKKNEIDPIPIKVSTLMVEALNHNPPLPVTAYVLRIALKAIGWELAGDTRRARRAVMKAMEKF